MFRSVLYVALQRALAAAFAAVRVDAIEGPRDHRPPPRGGRTAPPGPASGISGGRPSVPVGRKPPVTPHQLVGVCRHADAFVPAKNSVAVGHIEFADCDR